MTQPAICIAMCFSVDAYKEIVAMLIAQVDIIQSFSM